MIFFSEKKLARKLHEGQVTEKEQMIYLILFNLMYAIFMTTSFSDNSTNMPVNLYNYLTDALMLVFTIGIVIYCRFINNKGDGKDLLVRYTCLTIPIGIKFLPLSFIAGFLFFIVDNLDIITASEASFEPTESMEIGPCSFASIVVLYALLIWRYKVNFMIASGRVELK